MLSIDVVMVFVAVPLANLSGQQQQLASRGNRGGSVSSASADLRRRSAAAAPPGLVPSLSAAAPRKGSVNNSASDVDVLTNFGMTSGRASGSGGGVDGGALPPIHVIGHQDTPAVAIDAYSKTTYVATN